MISRSGPRGHFKGHGSNSQGRSHWSIPRIRPSADGRLKQVLEKIGVPTAVPFSPDLFQLEALRAIKESDCLVTAPTGSGKTWIALEAIRRVCEGGGRAWYTSPLKALSNSKLSEFSEVFGASQVGILTGDRKENADAPIIVATTEILRNQLYDAMHQGTDLAADLVVMDEAHFLGDPDRGVVWEEIMIYLPARIPLLLLSATIQNGSQIAEWLGSVRSRLCVVVEETHRPVPMFPLFLHPTGELQPLLESNRLAHKVKRYVTSPRPDFFSAPGALPPLGKIVGALRKYNLLPAIFFMKSRSDCDSSLDLCGQTIHVREEKHSALMQRLDFLLEKYPQVASHRHIHYLTRAAVASHHSGQLPLWKLVIEDLMTNGLLEAVFATSTVAAGVNFPARTVVFLNSDRYNGLEFVPLSGTEFHQATGRAGRRGKDNIGFAVVLPGKFMDIGHMAQLCSSPPENVLSQIRVDFSMVLNLLLSHSPQEIMQIFERSFATYLNLINQSPGLSQRLKESDNRLMELLPEAQCGSAEHVVELVKKRQDLLRDLAAETRQLTTLQARVTKMPGLVPGRLFLDSRQRLYCAIKIEGRDENAKVLACSVSRSKNHPKLVKKKWLRIQRVTKLLDYLVTLPKAGDFRAIQRTFAGLKLDPMPAALAAVEPATLSGQEDAARVSMLEQRCGQIMEALKGLVCLNCSHFGMCHTRRHRDIVLALDDFDRWSVEASGARTRLTNDFLRHLEFLKDEGFVSMENRPTHDGLWASQLRLDQPLVIAEGLRQNTFSDSDPAMLAALVAPFVCDRELPDEKLQIAKVPRLLLASFHQMRRTLDPLMEKMRLRGFPVKTISLWPAAAIYTWARGLAWEEVLQLASIADGDLAMLVTRTADNLRQLASLSKTHSSIAANALRAKDLIMKDPIAVV